MHRAVASPKAAEWHQAWAGGGTSGERARIKVAKALGSDMETPKALYRVKSGEGCPKRIFGLLFGHRTLLVDGKMRFLAFF